MAKSKNKKKKEKIVYIDDGSTISDMSQVGGVGRRIPSPDKNNAPRKYSTFGEKFATFFSAMKMMFLPMIVVLIVIAVFFLAMTIIAKFVN